ncbi:metallophosphoesterase [Aliidiomarina taiwanensis]|uniref:Metallophosphoesterase n=1 Tax=Aliidiomarina taiwanensis TaxID=946228 RepID=A0A432XAK5_9GAMM|nr:metallophosphoesterase [Aliidiomarina taiwanensis]RUO44271.1 metallophosphoesterase [Aliidiomarina taiwanensis]
MYDIIGDVHGYADRLIALLKAMGYTKKNGVWQHPERTLISVGDLVDRGTGQRETVDILRAMHEAGYAHVIMGNHEYNAVGWVTQDHQGNYLRPHTEKNKSQHAAFLAACEGQQGWYNSTIAWFKQLPLFLDLPELRVIHACWHEASLATVKPFLDSNNALIEEAWPLSGDTRQALHGALETLTKGWEVALPAGYFFADKDGHKRYRIRTKWWSETARSYRELAVGAGPKGALPTQDIPGGALPGYDNKKPLFLGHYWMRGTPHLLTPYIACVDWTVVEPTGLMAAYRYDGEQPLCNSKFISV